MFGIGKFVITQLGLEIGKRKVFNKLKKEKQKLKKTYEESNINTTFNNINNKYKIDNYINNINDKFNDFKTDFLKYPNVINLTFDDFLKLVVFEELKIKKYEIKLDSNRIDFINNIIIINLDVVKELFWNHKYSNSNFKIKIIK